MYFLLTSTLLISFPFISIYLAIPMAYLSYFTYYLFLPKCCVFIYLKFVGITLHSCSLWKVLSFDIFYEDVCSRSILAAAKCLLHGGDTYLHFFFKLEGGLRVQSNLFTLKLALKTLPVLSWTYGEDE